MAIWGELKMVVNSNFKKPLNEFIDEILDTKIRNHLYRSDDYCVLGSATTKTVVSSEKTVTGNGTSNLRGLLLGTFTIPDNCYDITVTASVKCSSANTQYVTMYYQGETAEIERLYHGSPTSYESLSVTLDPSEVVPGKTIEFYLYSSSNGAKYYCNSLKVKYQPYNRVVTPEKYLINTVKTHFFGTTPDIPFTQLPRHDRCEINTRYETTNYVRLVVVDGIEYVHSTCKVTALTSGVSKDDIIVRY